jgi:alpha-amylase
MPMVARMRRRLGASVLAALLVGCSPVPSGAPSGAPSGTPAAQATSGPTAAAACVPVAGAGSASRDTAPPSWATRTWYELFVRSFSDSDGDGVGDFAGATAKLDYLDDLGIGGIWLMPVAKAASYHGYDVTDYTAVEPDYGDKASLKAFVAAAHERGIEVIVDFVINHTSIDHPWFQDALQGGPHRDWYIWSDTDPGWPAIAGPNPWHRTKAGDYYYGAFWEGMPDLNLRNPAVTAEIDRIAGVWLDDFGVDGFRIDAAKHLIEDDGTHQANTPETLAWLADFTASVHAGHPDALVLGEVYDVSRTAGGYVPKSLDMTFDFGLASALVSALQTGRTAPIKTALDETLRFWPTNREASFLTNHDQNRVMSQLNGDVQAAKLAGGLLMTTPGVPFIYYGEEIGMQGRKPDERIRTPMQWSADAPAGGFSTHQPWEALDDDWQTVNVAAQADDPTSLLSSYRGAIRFRQSHPALVGGSTFLVDGGAQSVIGWLRASNEDLVLTVLNAGTTAVSDYALALPSGPLCGVSGASSLGAIGDTTTPSITAPTVNGTGGFDAYQPIGTLQPRSGYVIELSTQ